MRKYIILIFLFFILESYLSADNSYVFAPFISRLKAFEDNSSIKLTWKDSRDISGSYLIYRHTEQITRNNFSDAFLVDEIPEGVESYSDKVTDNTDFFYAVVIKESTGTIFNIFLPYRNITINPVSVKTINRIGDSAAYVKYLTVTQKKDTLVLNFDASVDDRQIAVLRNIEPIFNFDDLMNATILNIIPSYRKSYIDYPIAGVTYYYSVIDAELLKIQAAELIPFENTTLNGSEIPINTNMGTELSFGINKRGKPLPGYKLFTFLETGSTFSNTIPESSFSGRKPSQKTALIVEKLLSENSQLSTVKLDPEILHAKAEENTDNDAIRLSVILDIYFSEHKWNEAKTQQNSHIV